MCLDYQFGGVDPVDLEESDRVFTPSGFGVVISVGTTEAMVLPVRQNENASVVHSLDDIETIDDREWVMYEEGVVETPHR